MERVEGGQKRSVISMNSGAKFTGRNLCLPLGILDKVKECGVVNKNRSIPLHIPSILNQGT